MGEDSAVDDLFLRLCDEVNNEVTYMTDLMEVQVFSGCIFELLIVKCMLDYCAVICPLTILGFPGYNYGCCLCLRGRGPALFPWHD